MAAETPSALMLAPEAPYPLAGGGALRTASLLHYLAARYALDLIVFRQPDEPDPAARIPPGLVRRVTVIPLPSNRRDVFSRTLRNTARLARGVPPLVDRFAGFDAAVRQACDRSAPYEIAIVEHSWCAAYHDAIAPASRRTILDMHNVESLLHRRCAQTEAGAPGFAHRLFENASRDFERRWLPRFSNVLAPSDADRRAILRIAPSAHVTVYPNAIPFTPVPSRASEAPPDAAADPAAIHSTPPPRTEEDVIVFSGNLEYHPNIAAVRYFRSEIWPLLRARWPHLVWRLVGKNPAAVRRYTLGDPRIQMTGPVPDAIPELARAKVAVVPLLSGSGTRLKILEAWAAGTPVVSTPIGAEGLPVRDGEHLLLAENAADFAAAVSRLLACKELRRTIATGGRLLMENDFTWEKAWRCLDF